MAHCRSCHAEIEFLRLPSGKYHPVEGATPKDYHLDLTDATTKPQRVIVTDTGAFVCGHETPFGTRVKGYESHFATCPQGDLWRTPKGAHA